MLHIQSELKKKKIGLNYDALKDKFTSYYFNSYGIKKHLKKLRKAIELEIPNKSNRQYSQQLAAKISTLQQNSNPITTKIKPYQKSLKLSSLQQLKKYQNYYEQVHSKKKQNLNKKDENHLKGLPNISKTCKSVNKITEYSQNLTPTHDQFIKQIQNKNSDKQILSSNRNTVSNEIKLRQIYSKQRNNRSFFSRQNSKNIKRQIGAKMLKHDEFLNFLKQKKQELSKNDENKRQDVQMKDKKIEQIFFQQS